MQARTWSKGVPNNLAEHVWCDVGQILDVARSSRIEDVFKVKHKEQAEITMVNTKRGTLTDKIHTKSLN